MPDDKSISDYLGDGVHAQFMPDANQVCLFVERADGSTDQKFEVRIQRVCLTPEVLDALLRFASLCWPEVEDAPPT